MDEEPRRPDDQQLDALADSLQTHFTDHGKLIKKEIVRILVPTHNHVKNTFRILDKEVDTTYGQGAAILNKACKEYEGTVFDQMNDLTKAHEATRAKAAKIMEELKMEYAARELLWTKLRESVDEIVERAIAEVEDTPAKIERTIAKVEKKAKDLEAKDASSAKGINFKGLQDFLKAA